MSLENPLEKKKRTELVEAGEIQTEAPNVDEVEHTDAESVEGTPAEAPGNESEQGWLAEAEKVKNLGILDTKAKEVATQDRAKADALLTDMKDGQFVTHRDNRDFLEQRVEGAREAVQTAQENLDAYHDPSLVEKDEDRKRILDDSMTNWRAATQELQGYETEMVKPTVESLAHEKNPIAHSDYKEDEARETEGLLKTHFWWFAPVWTVPKKIFRRDEGKATPGGDSSR